MLIHGVDDNIRVETETHLQHDACRGVDDNTRVQTHSFNKLTTGKRYEYTCMYTHILHVFLKWILRNKEVRSSVSVLHLYSL